MTALTVPQVLRRAEQGCVCATGAIRIAIGGTTDVGGFSAEEYHLVEAADQALYDHLGDNPMRWNDDLGRMPIEVRAALLAAARTAEYLAEVTA